MHACATRNQTPGCKVEGVSGESGVGKGGACLRVSFVGGERLAMLPEHAEEEARHADRVDQDTNDRHLTECVDKDKDGCTQHSQLLARCASYILRDAC